jgi:predicted porin
MTSQTSLGDVRTAWRKHHNYLETRMTRNLMALACSVLCTGAVLAQDDGPQTGSVAPGQSIQPVPTTPTAPGLHVYGAIDLSLAATNSGAPHAGTALSFASGTASQSFIGFRGNTTIFDDVGLFAVLEAGFVANSGALKTYSGNYGTASASATGGTSVTGLFNKRSIVGVNGKYGMFSVGRDYTPLYYVAQAGDIFRLGLWGNVQESLPLSGTGADRYGQVSNAAFYVSPVYEHLQFRATYGLGSQSAGNVGAETGASVAPKRANRMAAVSFKYDDHGLVLTSAYQRLSVPLTTGSGSAALFTGNVRDRQDKIVGAKYTFGNYAVSAGYIDIDQPVPNSDGRDAWLGASARIGAGTVLAEVQRLHQEAATGAAKSASTWALGYVYPVAHRSSIYATYGQVNNDATGQFALTSNDSAVAAGVPGARVRGVAIGIRYGFE